MDKGGGYCQAPANSLTKPLVDHLKENNDLSNEATC